MICFPSIGRVSRVSYFVNAQDEDMVYVDAIEPSLVQTMTRTRLSHTSSEVVIHGEVRFGASSTDYLELAKQRSERLVPMPWEPGPVHAWNYGDGQFGHMTSGVTTGIGDQRSVIHLTEKPITGDYWVAIAAELHCKGKLTGATLHGKSNQSLNIQRALHSIRVGKDANEAATFGQVLHVLLELLLRRKALTLTVENAVLSYGGIVELRHLAILEWSRRIVDACCIPGTSLAYPAASVTDFEPSPVDLEFCWSPGWVIPIRVLRVLRLADTSDQPGENLRQPKDSALRVVSENVLDSRTTTSGGTELRSNLRGLTC